MGMQKPVGQLVDEVDKNINWEWWPPDDEDVAYQLADAWKRAAADLRSNAYRLDVWVNRLPPVWGDNVGTQFYNQSRMFGFYYRKLADEFDKIGDYARDYGDLLKKTKDDLKVELAINLGFFLASFAFPGGPAAVGAWVAGRIATIIAARIAAGVARKLVTGLVKAGLELGKEMFDEASTSLAQQVYGNFRGTQTGIDPGQIGRDAITGGVGAGLNKVLGAGGKLLKAAHVPSLPSNGLTRTVGSGLSNAATSPAANYIVENHDNWDKLTDVNGYVNATKESGVSSAIIGGSRTGGTELGTTLGGATRSALGIGPVGGGGGDGGGGGPTVNAGGPGDPTLAAGDAPTTGGAPTPAADPNAGAVGDGDVGQSNAPGTQTGNADAPGTSNPSGGEPTDANGNATPPSGDTSNGQAPSTDHSDTTAPGAADNSPLGTSDATDSGPGTDTTNTDGPTDTTANGSQPDGDTTNDTQPGTNDGDTTNGTQPGTEATVTDGPADAHTNTDGTQTTRSEGDTTPQAGVAPVAAGAGGTTAPIHTTSHAAPPASAPPASSQVNGHSTTGSPPATTQNTGQSGPPNEPTNPAPKTATDSTQDTPQAPTTEDSSEGDTQRTAAPAGPAAMAAAPATVSQAAKPPAAPPTKTRPSHTKVDKPPPPDKAKDDSLRPGETPMNPLRPGGQSLGRFTEGLTRDESGRITHVKGIPVAQVLRMLAQARAQQYWNSQRWEHTARRKKIEKGQRRQGHEPKRKEPYQPPARQQPDVDLNLALVPNEKTGKLEWRPQNVIDEVIGLALDTNTGEVFEGTNAEIDTMMHPAPGQNGRGINPKLKARRDEAHKPGFYPHVDKNGNVIPGDPRDQPAFEPDMYLHAEVRAANWALETNAENREQDPSIRETQISDLIVDAFFIWSAGAIPAACCANCSTLLHDAESNAGKRNLDPTTGNIHNEDGHFGHGDNKHKNPNQSNPTDDDKDGGAPTSNGPKTDPLTGPTGGAAPTPDPNPAATPNPPSEPTAKTTDEATDTTPPAPTANSPQVIAPQNPPPPQVNGDPAPNPTADDSNPAAPPPPTGSPSPPTNFTSASDTTPPAGNPPPTDGPQPTNDTTRPSGAVPPTGGIPPNGNPPLIVGAPNTPLPTGSSPTPDGPPSTSDSTTPGDRPPPASDSTPPGNQPPPGNNPPADGTPPTNDITPPASHAPPANNQQAGGPSSTNDTTPPGNQPPPGNNPPADGTPPTNGTTPPSNHTPPSNRPSGGTSPDTTPAGSTPPTNDTTPPGNRPPPGNNPPAGGPPSTNDTTPPGNQPPSGNNPPAGEPPSTNDTTPPGNQPPPGNNPPADRTPPTNDTTPPTNHTPPSNPPSNGTPPSTPPNNPPADSTPPTSDTTPPGNHTPPNNPPSDGTPPGTPPNNPPAGNTPPSTPTPPTGATTQPSRIVNGARGAVPSVPHSTFFARIGDNRLMRNVVAAVARAAMTRTTRLADPTTGLRPYAVAKDAGIDAVKITPVAGGRVVITTRDGGEITVVLRVGPTVNGHLAEFTVVGSTVELTLSPNVGKDNVERTLANALSQAHQLITGNTNTTDVLTGARHPGDNLDLSPRDHGRQAEVRHLDRSTRETSRLRQLRRRLLATEMAALVEDVAMHGDRDGALDRLPLADKEVADIVAARAPAGSRRPSWVAKPPTGLPALAAYGHQLVIQGLPGLAAASAIIASATSTAGTLAGVAVGTITVGSAVTGTLVKRWTAARNKKIGDANHEHAAEQRDHEAAQRQRKLLDTILARMRTSDVDIANGPPEHSPGAAPATTPTYLQRLLDRAAAPVIGVFLATPLVELGLSPLAFAGQAGVALLAYAAGPIVERYLRTAELAREVGMIDGVARTMADLVHAGQVAMVTELHSLFDRLDALAGVAPTGQAPTAGPSLSRPDLASSLPPYLANSVAGEIATFSRALEDIVNGKAGTIPLAAFRVVIGTLGMAHLDQNFNRAELAAVYAQVMYDEGTRHLDRQATFDEAMRAIMDRIDRQLTAAEGLASADQRVNQSAPSRAADLRRGDARLAESLPATRPVGMQSGRAFAVYSAIQSSVMAGAMGLGSALFGAGGGLGQWGGVIVVGSAAVGGVVAAWSKFRFRQAEQAAANAEIAYNMAVDRAADAGAAQRTQQYLAELMARELAATESGPPQARARPKIPMVIGPGDPRYAEYVKGQVAEELARLAREPRPYSLFDARRVALNRIDTLANRVTKAAEHAARTGNDRPRKRAVEKLAKTRLEYQRMVNDGTPMPVEAPDVDETRSGPTGDHTANGPLDERLRRYLDESIETPGGRAFYDTSDPKDAKIQRELSPLVPRMPGMYTVDMHGAVDAVFIGDDVLTADDLAALIEADPRYRGEAIWLFACWTGAEIGGFAQQLADRLGVEVVAPAQVAGNTRDGETFVSGKERDEFGNPKLSWPPNGFWTAHKPIDLNADLSGFTYEPSVHLDRINQREATHRFNGGTPPPAETRAGGPSMSLRPTRVSFEDDEWDRFLGDNRLVGADPPPNVGDPAPTPADDTRPTTPAPHVGTPRDAGSPPDLSSSSDGREDAGSSVEQNSSSGSGDASPPDEAGCAERSGETGEPPTPDQPGEPGSETPLCSTDERLWPDELADLIAESDTWSGGPVRLLAIDGELDEEFLRRLADLLGVPVTVPADTVIDGFPRCSSGTLMVYNETTPPPPGEWRTFTPRNAMTSTEAG